MIVKKRLNGAMFLVFSAILIGGCGTAKGMAKMGEGVAVGVGATAVGVADDTKGLWHGILTADNWIKKNLW